MMRSNTNTTRWNPNVAVTVTLLMFVLFMGTTVRFEALAFSVVASTSHPPAKGNGSTMRRFTVLPSPESLGTSWEDGGERKSGSEATITTTPRKTTTTTTLLSTTEDNNSDSTTRRTSIGRMFTMTMGIATSMVVSSKMTVVPSWEAMAASDVGGTQLVEGNGSQEGECQTVCMYKCNVSNSQSKAMLRNLKRKSLEQCQDRCSASVASVCTNPPVTQTREPRLINSQRIANLYETWQDDFCPDEDSICAHKTTDRGGSGSGSDGDGDGDDSTGQQS